MPFDDIKRKVWFNFTGVPSHEKYEQKNNFFDIFATFRITFHFCFVVALTCKSKLSIEPFGKLGPVALAED